MNLRMLGFTIFHLQQKTSAFDLVTVHPKMVAGLFFSLFICFKSGMEVLMYGIVHFYALHVYK
jgi:hypothetical protein